MSPGKLAAQVSHGSMAFLTTEVRKISLPYKDEHTLSLLPEDKTVLYKAFLYMDANLYEQWIDGEFTKCVLQARNKNHLLKAKITAEELGMKEGIDFFCIYDNCHTELEPEENGRTLTVIGFKPMDSDVIDKIGRKYHLYI